MNAVVQFDIFEDETLSVLKSDVVAQKESLRKIQKKLFGQMGDVTKMLFELYAQNEQLNQQYQDAQSVIASLVERIEVLEKRSELPQ